MIGGTRWSTLLLFSCASSGESSGRALSFMSARTGKRRAGSTRARGAGEREDQRALHGAVPFFDGQAQLLFDHRLQKDARRACELRGDTPRGFARQALSLEHVRDLGLRLVRSLRDLATLLLDLREEDLA